MGATIRAGWAPCSFPSSSMSRPSRGGKTAVMLAGASDIPRSRMAWEMVACLAEGGSAPPLALAPFSAGMLAGAERCRMPEALLAPAAAAAGFELPNPRPWVTWPWVAKQKVRLGGIRASW